MDGTRFIGADERTAGLLPDEDARVEPVITDLALTSPFHVPQGQISVSQGQMAVSQGQAVNLPEQTATPQAVTERHENAANRQETQSRPDCMPCAECTAMVTYLIPDMETQKHRSESATLYIDYPTGVYDVRREFHNNRPELEKLDSLMRPLTKGIWQVFQAFHLRLRLARRDLQRQ